MKALAAQSHERRQRPTQIIEPDVPISGIRLSDWLHVQNNSGHLSAAAVPI
jgi:hypothetical protein